MATSSKRRAGAKTPAKKTEAGYQSSFQYCSEPVKAEREFAPSVNGGRMALIRRTDTKWVNGTRLHYYFFTSSRWRGTPAQRDVVRDAFTAWKDVGIGLEFLEVNSPEEAEIRIGFQRGDGAWSYLGRDILGQAQDARTMNFGWDISNDIDTPIHEIGHTLGFPHEHQNPNAGIVWDEEAVYADLGGPPNNWPRDKTFHNIIRKLTQSEVDGSDWDPDSIMHYPFSAGLILEPADFRTRPLQPAPGLSTRDIAWVTELYPPLDDSRNKLLKPFRSVQSSINPGEQLDFRIEPAATRTYHFGTFGDSDTVMVLFEETANGPRYLAADDDSGEDFNSLIELKLFAGQQYILRVRLYWQNRKGDFGVMMW